jgi:uncharacterized protein YdeI (YjbR/CyaY-like superfamily)
MSSSKPKFFRTPERFRAWLKKSHASKSELLVGFYRKDSGEPSLSWPESVDEALCFGWIDGIRRRIDERSYSIRFTPRKPTSTWSRVNIARAEALIEEGRMQPAGLAAYKRRKENRSGIYSYEQRKPQLEEPYAGKLKRKKKAWDFFQAQPPSYRKAVSWWIVSAKREETRLRRLNQLIECSTKGTRIPQYLSRRK